MLIAAAGLAGSGKTTALTFLSGLGLGSYDYIGIHLRAAVLERGLALTPENERAVREELREQQGMAAMAKLALPELRRKLTTGHVFVDAIYNEEERECYLDALGAQMTIIGVRASARVRAKRLALRPERPISEKDLFRRDRYELEALRLGDVIAQADVVLCNDDSLAVFEERLVGFAAKLRA